MSEDRYDHDFNTGTSEIICTDCGTSPRLKSLDKNSGTQTKCDCDDVRHSMDSVPYELSVHDLPDSWEVVEDGRSPRQLSSEVDAMLDSGAYECPACGDTFGMLESVSCSECGHIPDEVKDA